MENRTFQLASGKDDPRLWLADALSNASHNNFTTIGECAGIALKNSLTPYDWTLSFDQTLQLTSELIEHEAFGLAIISLAERISSEATSDEANKRTFASQSDRPTHAAFAAVS